MREPISRRTLLQRLVGGIALTGMGSVASSCRIDDLQLSYPDWLVAGFDIDAVRALGERYLADHPQERDERRLAASVVSAARGPQFWSRARPLTEVVAAEFAAGDTVLVDGWMLSRTEARLCAVQSLRADRPSGGAPAAPASPAG